MLSRFHSYLRELTLALGLLYLVGGATSWARGETPGTPSTAGTDRDGWKNIFDGKSLDGWQPADYFKPAKVVVKNGVMVIPTGRPMTGIVYSKGDFPKTDYEVSLEGRKVEGSDFFCTTTFPVDKSFCSLVVGGWGGSVIGLSNIDSQDASENETSNTKEFQKNQWYHIRIRVSPRRIEAWIDRDKVVDLDTSERQISTRIECDACQPFGIATYSTTGEVRHIRVRALSTIEKKTLAQAAEAGKSPIEDFTAVDPRQLGVQAIVAQKDAKTGFIIGGRNATGLIEKLTEIGGQSLKSLEANMRPGGLSTAGFLGKGERLLDILTADNRYVVDELGLTHQQLALPLRVLGTIANQEPWKEPKEFTYRGQRFKIQASHFRATAKSPFEDGTQTNCEVTLKNVSTGKTLTYSLLVPEMIERYGFYEGKDTRFRVEPEAICQVLGFLPTAKKP